LTEAQLSALAFREADLEDLVDAQLLEEKQDKYTIWKKDLKYGVSGVQNPAAGEMTLPVEFSATLGKTIDVDALTDRIKDKSEDELRGIILGISGVENAQISLWPFWVRTVPQREGRIEITIK